MNQQSHEISTNEIRVHGETSSEWMEFLNSNGINLNGVRVHGKSSSELKKFLKDNKKTFVIEKTSSGFPTIHYAGQSVYFREKVMQPASLNRIITFHNMVAASDLFAFLKKIDKKIIQEESDIIEQSLLYKGFYFDPAREKKITGAIKIDFNSAYWQTCRYMRLIDRKLYRRISTNCIKKTRLRLTGTLGKKNILTPYLDGIRLKSFVKDDTLRRVIFQNIYNRIRKFVDELMVWVWLTDPLNFIGYYTDCIWLRELDPFVINHLEKMYDLKIDIVDLMMEKNRHGKINMIETNETDGARTSYDAQFKSKEFVNYKNLYNFNPDLEGINLQAQWQMKTM